MPNETDFFLDQRLLRPKERFEVELDLLTKKQLAEKLGIGPRTLDVWLRERKIPCLKIGGIYRFSWPRVRQALEAYEVKEVPRA